MRIIDADKLKRKVQQIATEAWKMKLTASVETTLNQFIDYVDEAPTIEQPKRGEWEERPSNEFISVRRWYCSECGNWQTYGMTDYCPNCGARMRGEQE